MAKVGNDPYSTAIIRISMEWLQQTEVELVQNRNISQCVEVVNEAESIRSAIRDYLAHR